MEIDFEFVFESAPDAILIVSGQGRIVRINAEAERMFGYSRQELLDQPLEVLLPERLRAAHAMSREKYACSPCARPMGESNTGFRARHRDGGEFFVDVSLSPATAGGVIAIARDISDRKRMNQQLGELTAKLERNAAVALLAGQEAEGSRIARELHDSACQNLCALLLDMAQLQQELPRSFGHVRNRIRSQEEKLRALADELACVCRQLHPSVLERIGLNRALEQLCKEFTERKGLHTQFLLADTPASLPEASALCLYRVAQEALRNILRHARATHATVRLCEGGGGLHLSIEDDGTGFDPGNVDGKAGLGLVSMQERVRLAGGSISVHSEPGHGTRIHVRVPLLDGSERPESCDTRLATVAAS